MAMSSIWGFSVDELALKQKAAEAQNRKGHVHQAARVGDVERVLRLLEQSEDPATAQQLAKKAKATFVKANHFHAAQVLDRTLGDFAEVRLPLPESERPPKYDVHTAQIATGKVGSLLVTIVCAADLPAKDGLTGSCDPFCKISLWESDEAGRRQKTCERTTEVKMMSKNPEWNETFQLDIDNVNMTLVAEVHDWDEDNTHDFIGKVTIPLNTSVSKLLEDRDACLKRNEEVSENVRDIRAVQTYNLGKTYQSFWKTGAKSELGTTKWLPVRAELSKFGRSGVSVLSQSASALPDEKRLALCKMDGSASSTLGSIHLILQVIPAQRVATVSGIQLYPRKGLERINALTPASQLVFTDDEFLENKSHKDARFAKDRVLTRDVLWPKGTEGAYFDSTKIFRQALAHASWRTMVEPVRGCPPRNREKMLDQDASAVVHLARSLGGGREETLEEIKAQRAVRRAEGKVQEAETAWLGGRMAEATGLLEDAVALAQEGGDRGLEATGRKRLGDAYLMQGQFRRARDQHRQHLDMAAQQRAQQRPRSVLKGGRGHGAEGEGAGEEVWGEEQATAACAREGVAVKAVLGQLVQEGELEHRGQGFGRGVRRGALERVLREVKTAEEEAYWRERAMARLERVDWTSGQGQVKMEAVRDTILELKQQRAGQLPPPYVPPSQWGGAPPLP